MVKQSNIYIRNFIESLEALRQAVIVHAPTQQIEYETLYPQNILMPYLDGEMLADRVVPIIDWLREAVPEDGRKIDYDYFDQWSFRLHLMKSQVIPQLFHNGNAPVAVSGYLFTLDALERWVIAKFPKAVNIDPTLVPTRMAGRVKRMNEILQGIKVDKDLLISQLTAIKDAHDIVESLPSNVAELKESIRESKIHATSAEHLNRETEKAKSAAVESYTLIKHLAEKTTEESAALLRQAGIAYSAVSTRGLAESFRRRAVGLNFSMWTWVVLLVVTLVIAGYFGTERVRLLSELIAKNEDPKWGVVLLHFGLSVVSVGAPLWFAWIATKQMRQVFSLAEDYGYKASVAKAYQGYKNEAALVDKDFEKRLFSSALDMLGEAPSRLLHSDVHGSPWHELASNTRFIEALDKVPGLAASVLESVQAALSKKTKNASS